MTPALAIRTCGGASRRCFSRMRRWAISWTCRQPNSSRRGRACRPIAAFRVPALPRRSGPKPMSRSTSWPLPGGRTRSGGWGITRCWRSLARAAWAPSTRRSRIAHAALWPSRSSAPASPRPPSSSGSTTRPRSWAGCITRASRRSTRPASPTTASRISRWSLSTGCRWTSMPAAAASTSLPAWVSWRGCATRCSTRTIRGSSTAT